MYDEFSNILGIDASDEERRRRQELVMQQQLRGGPDDPVARLDRQTGGQLPSATDEPETAAVEEPDTQPQQAQSSQSSYRPIVNPMSPLAKRYAQQVQEYQGDRMAGEGGHGTYKDPSTGQTMNLPQQYGQAGSPTDPEEGPLTPEQTAARLAAGENRIVNLGPKRDPAMLLGRQRNYQKYVADLNAQRDAERNRQREQAFANRANIADRDAMTMRKLYDYNNAIQGGGSMGSYDNQGPSVSRIGGAVLLRGLGRFRPMDSMEQADLANKQAQTNYMNQRPQMAQDANAIKMLELERKIKEGEDRNTRFKQGLLQRDMMFKQGMDHRRLIEQRLATGQTAHLAEDAAQVAKRMETFAQMMRIKLQAAQSPGRSLFNPMGNPDPAARDAWIDPKTMQLDTSNVVPGDFDKIKDALATEIETFAKINPQAPLPESVTSVLQLLQGG